MCVCVCVCAHARVCMRMCVCVCVCVCFNLLHVLQAVHAEPNEPSDLVYLQCMRREREIERVTINFSHHNSGNLAYMIAAGTDIGGCSEDEHSSIFIGIYLTVSCYSVGMSMRSNTSGK